MECVWSDAAAASSPAASGQSGGGGGRGGGRRSGARTPSSWLKNFRRQRSAAAAAAAAADPVPVSSSYDMTASRELAPQEESVDSGQSSIAAPSHSLQSRDHPVNGHSNSSSRNSLSSARDGSSSSTSAGGPAAWLTQCLFPKERSSEDESVAAVSSSASSQRAQAAFVDPPRYMDVEGSDGSGELVAAAADADDDDDAVYDVGDIRRERQTHTQVDYTNYLIPNMNEVVSCPYYWGKIDRYEAEALLEDKPEGAFLLRDSAQDDFVFSVSFRRYNRSLHARIEQANHKFSFDCHDPGVHASRSICGLLEYYKNPESCMFFEPMLLYPVARKNCFSLQELARSVVSDHCSGSFSGVTQLPLPKPLKTYIREYNYRHKIRTRYIE